MKPKRLNDKPCTNDPALNPNLRMGGETAVRPARHFHSDLSLPHHSDLSLPHHSCHFHATPTCHSHFHSGVRFSRKAEIPSSASGSIRFSTIAAEALL